MVSWSERWSKRGVLKLGHYWGLDLITEVVSLGGINGYRCIAISIVASIERSIWNGISHN